MNVENNARAAKTEESPGEPLEFAQTATPESNPNRLTTTIARVAGVFGLGRASLGNENPEAPRRVGRFVVLRRIGAGGMGVVYSAYDEQLNRKVAVKLVKPEARRGTQSSRVLREAQAMARLSHPNVVQVYEVGEFEGQIFLAMEFVDGPTLGDWVSAESRTWQDVLSVFIEAGRGLESAHSQDIVHRDFKPGNVIVGRDGRPRVLDFGLAHAQANEEQEVCELDETKRPNGVLEEPMTEAGSVLGTPAYMSPEQHASKPTDARSDQFSYCVALYEAIYGKRPFDGSTIPVLAFQTMAGVYVEPDTRTLARGLWPILKRGLDPDPNKRWPTMKELLSVLEGLINVDRRRYRLFPYAAGFLVFIVGIWLAAEASARSKLSLAVDRLGAIEEMKSRYASERRAAIELFMNGDADSGENAWEQVRITEQEIFDEYGRAFEHLESGLSRNPLSIRVNEEYNKAYYSKAVFLDSLYRHDEARQSIRLLRQRRLGTRYIRKWESPKAVLIVAHSRGSLRFNLDVYREDQERCQTRSNVGEYDAPVTLSLNPGSYRVSSGGQALQVFVVPRGGGATTVEIWEAPHVPDGFVFIPPGRYVFGSAEIGTLRREFLHEVPAHTRDLHGFVIGKHEVTFSQYIEFLNDVAGPVSQRLAPNVDASFTHMGMALAKTDAGWMLRVFGAEGYRNETSAIQGELIKIGQDYMDWENLPVLGLSMDMAREYPLWLDETGRLPGARICTGQEWVRAARGSDSRAYTTGNCIAGDMANIEDTSRGAPVPREVGSFPRSESPFGLHDMIGNAIEFVIDVQGESSVRGGAYPVGSYTARIDNRVPMPPNTEIGSLGLRVCASIDPSSHTSGPSAAVQSE